MNRGSPLSGTYKYSSVVGKSLSRNDDEVPGAAGWNFPLRPSLTKLLSDESIGSVV